MSTSKVYGILKKISYKLIGPKFTGMLRLYSPHSLIMSILRRQRYANFYQRSKSIFTRSQTSIPRFKELGCVEIKQALALNTTFLTKLDKQFFSGNVMSLTRGFFVPGVQADSSYTYLTKEALWDLGLPELLMHTPAPTMAIDQLENHLGAYLRITHADIYKTYANRYTKAYSFLWHRDNQPYHSYKLLVYLKDCQMENGPFGYLEGSHRGYSGLAQFGWSRRRDQNPEKPRFYMGQAGDGILFDVNGFHAGGHTKQGERIVLVLSMTPSLVPWREYMKNYGFSVVPDIEYSLKPEHIWWDAHPQSLLQSHL